MYVDRQKAFQSALGAENPLALVFGINAREDLCVDAKQYLVSAVLQIIKMREREKDSESKGVDEAVA